MLDEERDDEYVCGPRQDGFLSVLVYVEEMGTYR